MTAASGGALVLMPPYSHRNRRKRHARPAETAHPVDDPARSAGPRPAAPSRARRFPVERAPPSRAFDWKPARSRESAGRAESRVPHAFHQTRAPAPAGPSEAGIWRPGGIAPPRRVSRRPHPGSPPQGRPRGGAHGTPGTIRGGDLSKSVAKAPRAGIDREQNRGISTILLARSGAMGAFATDLDNSRRRGPDGGRGGRPDRPDGPCESVHRGRAPGARARPSPAGRARCVVSAGSGEEADGRRPFSRRWRTWCGRGARSRRTPGPARSCRGRAACARSPRPRRG